MHLKIKDKNLFELLKGSSISLVFKLFSMGLGYMSMLFITNVYGAEEWGVYSLCLTLLSIFTLLPKFGYDNSLVRIIAEVKAYYSKKALVDLVVKAFLFSCALTVLVVVIIAFSSNYLIDELIKNNELKQLLWPISLSIIPSVVLTIVGAVYQAFKKPWLFIVFQTGLINLTFMLFLLLDYYLGFGKQTFVIYSWAVFLSSVISAVALFMLLTKYKSEGQERKEKKHYSLHNLTTLSFPMLLSSSFALLMGWSDILMLSFYKSSFDIGIYNSTLRLATLSTISLIAINAIASPKFVEFYTSSDMDGLKKVVKQSTKLVFFTSAPILLILMVFSKQILSLFGEEFAVGYWALIFLCLSRFVNAISGSVGYIMQMTDQQKVYQRVILLAFIINLTLNFILIPRYSFTGAAIASSIAMIFWNLTLVIIIKKKLGFWTIFLLK